MSWKVNWNGREIDADPCGFSGLELQLVKERVGLGFWDLIRGIPKMEPDAVRATFWVAERREDQELKFSDYHGPSFRDLIPYLPAFRELVEELGKAVKTLDETSERPGGPDSPSSTPDASTETFTTG